MFKKILFPIDLNEPASWRHALPVAIAEAGGEGATLHVLTVLPEFSAQVSQYFAPTAREKLRAASVSELAEFVAKHVPQGIACQQVVSEGTVYEEIISAAEAIDADLIVMASHKPDAMRDFLLGANAAQVVRHCPRSVLVVRGKPGA